MEQTGLSWLTKLAIEHNNQINSIHPIASLLKLSYLTVYKPNYDNLVKQLQHQTIQFLLTVPEEVVDWAYSLNENEYKVKYGGGALKIALLGMCAEFYLEYKKIREEKKQNQTPQKDWILY